jgi:cytochrome P450
MMRFTFFGAAAPALSLLPSVMNRSPTSAGHDLPPAVPESHDLGSTDETIDLMVRWFAEYGDTYRVYAPGRKSWTWVVHDPEDIKRVLVTNHRNYTKGVGIDRVRLLLGNGIMTSEGDLWRRQRRMMQPAFHRRVIENFSTRIRAASDRLVAQWDAAAGAGKPVNLTESMSEMTLEIVLDSLFGEDLSRLVTDVHDNPFMLVTQESKRNPKFAYEFRQLGRVVLELARERLAQPAEHYDFLQMLLEARDPDSGAGMSERELVDEVLTLVVAGHETTASALNWTWWLLSQHPDVEARLHAEQDRAGDLGAARYGDLERLPYTQQVLFEAMRLYPPGWLLTRRAIALDRLGGYELPAGTDVFLSPYVVHRHPRYWANPDDFDPEHFAPPLVEARHKFIYIPFAAGPRHCIGENFSIHEMLLHLNSATRRFRLRPTDSKPVQIEARINLRPAEDLIMRVERR